MSVNLHWCGEEIMDRSLSFGLDDLGCGMEDVVTLCGDESNSDDALHKGTCCTDQHAQISVDNEWGASRIQLTDAQLAVVLPVLLPFVPQTQDTPASNSYIPQRERLRTVPLYILHEVYLI